MPHEWRLLLFHVRERGGANLLHRDDERVEFLRIFVVANCAGALAGRLERGKHATVVGPAATFDAQLVRLALLRRALLRLPVAARCTVAECAVNFVAALAANATNRVVLVRLQLGIVKRLARVGAFRWWGVVGSHRCRRGRQ